MFGLAAMPFGIFFSVGIARGCGAPSRRAVALGAVLWWRAMQGVLSRAASSGTLAALVVLGGAPALAEAPQRVVVLPPTVSEGAPPALGGTVDRLVRARLDAHPDVALAEAPALGLADIQLAVGCAGETPACLDAVAATVGGGTLLWATIDAAGADALVTLAWYRGGETRRKVERVPGDRQEEVVAAVDTLLSDLLGLPPVEPTPAVAAPATPAVEPGRPVLPYVVGGVGVAALLGGVIAGALAEESEAAYAGARLRTARDVDAALDHRTAADDRALAANILFGVGGALAVTGAILYFALPAEEIGVTISPAPGGAGLSLQGTLGGWP